MRQNKSGAQVLAGLHLLVFVLRMLPHALPAIAQGMSS